MCIRDRVIKVPPDGHGLSSKPISIARKAIKKFKEDTGKVKIKSAHGFNEAKSRKPKILIKSDSEIDISEDCSTATYPEDFKDFVLTKDGCDFQSYGDFRSKKPRKKQLTLAQRRRKRFSKAHIRENRNRIFTCDSDT